MCENKKYNKSEVIAHSRLDRRMYDKKQKV